MGDIEWNILLGGRTDEKDWVILLVEFKGSVHNSVVSYMTSQMVLMMSLTLSLILDLGQIFEDSLCDIGPILCGPPQLQLFGGQVLDSQLNPVIGDNGSIIGVDILSVGSGYQPNENVYAQIVDACGRGGGSVITPFLGTSFWYSWCWRWVRNWWSWCWYRGWCWYKRCH